ncbi:hypothetical protein AD951_06110 [Acetobacter malorum]|uniref:Uncharacterized protein n=1 Tax=Acetobacter malorum TaxID=178901 RepID=A0A149UNP4_9PROT|nr:hypothetical protein AD951_06110 [Acetobacter malorum]
MRHQKHTTIVTVSLYFRNQTQIDQKYLLIQCFLSEKKNRFEPILSVTQKPQSFLDTPLASSLTVKTLPHRCGGTLARSGAFEESSE